MSPERSLLVLVLFGCASWLAVLCFVLGALWHQHALSVIGVYIVAAFIGWLRKTYETLV